MWLEVAFGISWLLFYGGVGFEAAIFEAELVVKESIWQVAVEIERVLPAVVLWKVEVSGVQ